MPNIPIQYSLRERVPGVGKLSGKTVYQAVPTGRKRISFRSLSEEVARNTTFAPEEVQAVINLMTKIAKAHVENGNIVEMGDLGTLTPSFKSVLVEKTERGEDAFNAHVHISKPTVRFRPNRQYFELRGVSYERVAPKPKSTKTSSGASANTSGSPASSTKPSASTGDGLV